MKKKLGMVLLSGFLCVSLTACGSSDYKSVNQSFTMSDSAPAAMEESSISWGDGFAEDTSYESMDVSEGEMPDAPKMQDTSRKLIKNYDLRIETETMDELLPVIESEIARLGGYIESLNTYNGSTYANRSERYSNITIRVPANSADAFVEFAGNHGNITNKSLDVTDVTMTYVDIAAQRDSLRVQQERLLSFMEQAETVEDILDIEERLTNVRYRLESLESQLRTYDNLVSYSTIRLEITEVIEYTVPAPVPKTYGQKLAESFKEGWSDFVRGLQNFTIWFVGALPTLLLWAVIIAVVVFVIIKVKAKNKVKKQAEYEKAMMNVPAKQEGNTPPMIDKEK